MSYQILKGIIIRVCNMDKWSIMIIIGNISMWILFAIWVKVKYDTYWLNEKYYERNDKDMNYKILDEL